MCFAAGKSKRARFFVDRRCFSQTIGCVQTRGGHMGVEVVVGDAAGLSAEQLAQYCGVLVQYPDAEGVLGVGGHGALAERVHAAGVAAELRRLRPELTLSGVGGSHMRAAGVEVVALAGYMRILTPWLVRAWEGRMLNIHPSLLPLYPGLDTHARALAAGDAEAGCTVHLVTEGVDEGPILGQARVPILSDDTPAALAERVKTAEHRLYPQVLEDFCMGLARG
jgi:methionyl-tRNA formyltransferase